MFFAAGDSRKELKDTGFLLGKKINPEAANQSGMNPASVCFWEYSQSCAQGESWGRNSVYGRVFIVGGGLAAAGFVVIESVLLLKKVGGMNVYLWFLVKNWEKNKTASFELQERQLCV